LALGVALLTTTALVPLPAAAAPPPYTMEERAVAIAGPALIYVENRVSGFVRRTGTGEALHSNPIVITFRCSGFAVDPQSVVVTSTQCVRPTNEVILSNGLALLASDRKLTGAERDAFIRDNTPGVAFTGNAPASQPTQQVFGQLFQGQSNLNTEPAVEGQVMEALPVADGGVALVKFPLAMPSVELTDEPVSPTSTVVMLAYNADAGSNVYVPKSKSVHISGRLANKTPAQYQVDGELGFVSIGGMVVDSGGRVIGMIIPDPTQRERLNKAFASVELIKTVFAKAGVINSLSTTDNNYRSGLNDYYGGRYTDSIEKLDSVISLMPDHSLAKGYRKQAADRLAVEGDSGSGSLNWLFVAVGLGLTQLVSIILIIVLLARRRRVDAAGAPGLGLYAPISGMPVSGSPISITPISGGPYETYHTFHEGPTRLNPDEYTTLPVDPAQQQENPRDPGGPWAPR
jgi:hypothetical protein